MRYSPSEKMEIIRLVEGSNLPVKRTLEELAVPRSLFYRWYRAYSADDFGGLTPKPSQRRRFWNRIPDEEREQVVSVAIEKPELSPRELAWQISWISIWDGSMLIKGTPAPKSRAGVPLFVGLRGTILF